MANRTPPGVCQILKGDDPESAKPVGSGILIDANWVLTAAHVASRLTESPLWVRVDETDTRLPIAAEYHHAEYTSKESEYDIAALQLASPADEQQILPFLDHSIWYLTRYQNLHLNDSFTCWGRPKLELVSRSNQVRLKQRVEDVGESALGTLQLDAGIPDGFSGGPVTVYFKDGTPACLGMAVMGGLHGRTVANSSVILGPQRLSAWLNEVTQDKPAIPHRLLSPKNRHYFSIAPWAQPQDPIAQLKAGEVADLLTWSQALTELVGRDDLLAKFDNWADTAATGKLRCRMLHGEGGLGKTRFAMHWLEHMSQKGWQAFYINGSGALPDLSAGLYDRDPWLLVWDYPETALANQRLVETIAHWAGGSAPRVVLLLSRYGQSYWDPIFAELTLNPSLFSCDYQAMPLLEANHSYAVLTETLRMTGADPSRVEWNSYKSWMDGADAQGNANHELHARRQYLRYPLLTIGQGLCLALDPQLTFAQLTDQAVIDKLVERERKRLKHLEQRLSLKSHQVGVAERLQLLAIWLGELSFACLQVLAEDSRMQHLGLPAGEELEAFLDERGLGILKNNALQPLAPDVLAAGFAFRLLHGFTNQQSIALPHWLAKVIEKTSVANALERLGQRHHDWTFGLRRKLGDDDRFWQVWQAVFAQYPELAQRACEAYFSSNRCLLPKLGIMAWQAEGKRIQPLAQQDFAAYGPDLARSLNNLSVLLAKSGNRKGGLAAIQEAVTIRRALAEANFAAYGPVLAMSLNNLSNCLAESGDRKGGLEAIQEAVTIHRALAEANFAAYGPDLALSLNTLSNRLAESGDRDSGLEAIQEAVTIHRALAEANFAAYGPDLAWSLRNLYERHLEVGNDEQGLEALEVALEVYIRCSFSNTLAFADTQTFEFVLRVLIEIYQAQGLTEKLIPTLNKRIEVLAWLAERAPEEYGESYQTALAESSKSAFENP